MDLKRNLSENIKLIRGIKSQGEFAKQIGVGKSTIQAVEKQSSSVRLDTLEMMAQKLKISAGDLLSDPATGWTKQILQQLDWFMRLSGARRKQIMEWLEETVTLLNELSRELEDQ